MTQPLTRPTNHDEDWRYADSAYLADADLAALAKWEELTVAPGEKQQIYRVVDGGQSQVVRLRGEGARAPSDDASPAAPPSPGTAGAHGTSRLRPRIEPVMSVGRGA